jgi:hypothetical protein
VALNAHALTTVAIARGHLGLADTAATTTKLERLINAASEAIEKHCSRHFERSATASPIVETVAGRGGNKILLKRTPIVSITSIEILSDSDGTVTDTYVSTTYRIEDANVGTVFRSAGFPWSPQIAENISGSGLPGTESKCIRVTYHGGYITPAQEAAIPTYGTRDLPASIEEACLIAVASLYRRDGQDRTAPSQGVGEGPTVNFETKSGPAAVIPEAALALINPYRRIV